MRAMVITDEVRERIAAVRAYAQAHVFTPDQMQAMASGKMDPPGDSACFRLEIPIGFRVVYSLEEQPKMGLSHHLSVSVAARNRLPNEIAVQELMELFGMRRSFKEGGLWIENLADGGKAINIVQAVKNESEN